MKPKQHHELVDEVNRYLRKFNGEDFEGFKAKEWVRLFATDELLGLQLNDDGCIATAIGRYDHNRDLISATYFTTESDRMEVIL